MTPDRAPDDDAKSASVAPNAETPQTQAEKLVREAWAAASDDAMRSLAERALEIDPDSPDALAITAQFAEDPGSAMELLERAVSVAEERIGTELFAESAGHFSEVPETHPYLRARMGLARQLWDIGERDAAIEHANALLELDPEDDQGVHQTLLGWLLSAQKPAPAAKLMRTFGNGESALMLWGRALQLYQSFGATMGSDVALADAIKANPMVVGYLAHIEEPPDQVPDSFEFGGKGDAVIAALLLSDAWYSTDGALQWLANIVGRAPIGPKPSARDLN